MKLLKTFAAILLITNVIAINAQTEQKPYALSLFLGKSDYIGNDGRNSLGEFEPFYAVGGLSISKYLNAYFDAVLSAHYGTWGEQAGSTNKFSRENIALDIAGKFKPFKSGFSISSLKINPYLTLGLGFRTLFTNTSFTSTTNDLIIPLGFGTDFQVNEDFGFKFQSTWAYTNHGVDGDGFDLKAQTGTDFFINTTVGIYFNLSSDRAKAKMNDVVAPIKEMVAPLDTDKDGIADADDKCPTVAGVASNNGCPAIIDTDKDGIADADDKCPTVAGVDSNNGCPAIIDTDKDGIADADDKCPTVAGPASNTGCPIIIDTDKDGIADADDKCPTVAGPASNTGCPIIIDTDKDGIADADDKCPNVAGPASNTGCPAVADDVKKTLALALKGVQFESGKSIIKTNSYGILDNVVTILKAHPEYKLNIAGHTDAIGNAAKNLQLSKDRAKAVKTYLSNKSIDANRLFSEGYGAERPIDDNATKAGQEANRRVELSIIQ